MKSKCPCLILLLLFFLKPGIATAGKGSPEKIRFIDFYYENASPLIWAHLGDTAVKIEFLYDYERGSSNRQSTHFNFKIHAEPGTELNIILSWFRNIYNGRVNTGYARIPGQSLSCYFSEDNVHWEGVYANPVKENSFDHQVKYTMKSDVVYVAKLPVYSVSHLDRLLERTGESPCAEIRDIGHTVEGRPLEVIRLGNPGAENHVLIRARSHAWEPVGNWVVEGLIKRMTNVCALEKDSGKLCFHITLKRIEYENLFCRFYTGRPGRCRSLSTDHLLSENFRGSAY